MKIATKEFVSAIGMAATVLERRNTIPVLSTVLIAPDERGLICRATDLDVQVDVRLRSAAPDTSFAHCLLEPQRLAKILGGVQADEIGIDGDAGAVELKAGQEFRAKHSTLPAEDFPQIYASDAGWSASLPRSAVDALLRVAGAMSKEETRYYLNGVYFHHLSGWTYRFAATDGHRLYYADVELPDANGERTLGHAGGKDGERGIIIPSKTINLISRLRARGSDQPVTMSIRTKIASNDPINWTATNAASIARFELSGAGDREITITSKLIDGTFPDYLRVIPGDDALPNRVTLKCADLRRVAYALSQGSTERTKALKIRLAADHIEVAGKFVDSGFEGAFRVPAQVNVAGLEIGFNGNYLLSLLNSLGSDEATIMLGDAASPARVVDPTCGSFGTVLMPMRV